MNRFRILRYAERDTPLPSESNEKIKFSSQIGYASILSSSFTLSKTEAYSFGDLLNNIPFPESVEVQNKKNRKETQIKVNQKLL